MPIRIECPNCKKPAQVPDSAVGKTAKCKCGTSFVIRTAVPAEPEIELEESEDSIPQPQAAPLRSSPTSQTNTASASSDSKFCGSCGKPLIGGDAFCPHCGTPLISTQAPHQSVPAKPVMAKVRKQNAPPSYVFLGWAALGNPETAFFSTWMGRSWILAVILATAYFFIFGTHSDATTGNAMCFWLVAFLGGIPVWLVSYEIAKARFRNAFPNALKGLNQHLNDITPVRDTTKGFSINPLASLPQTHGTQARVIRCDSCGAGITEMAPKCRYCGQTSTIEIRGVRSTVLLEMYLHASQWNDLANTSAEILKEHPANALAWASKGVVSVATENLLTQPNPEDAIKCFELADRYSQERSLIQHFRRRAAELCLVRSQESWFSCVNRNSNEYSGLWIGWYSATLENSYVDLILGWAGWALKIDSTIADECQLLIDNANNVWAFHRAWRRE